MYFINCHLQVVASLYQSLDLFGEVELLDCEGLNSHIHGLFFLRGAFEIKLRVVYLEKTIPMVYNTQKIENY